MDRDYTGNVGVILGNIGTATLSVQLGHRIAQLICECIAVPVPSEVLNLGLQLEATLAWQYRYHGCTSTAFGVN